MKLAITSEGEGLQSLVDPRFGRARFFVVTDAETQTGVARPNAVNLNAD
jgi:predicted Fe-Mo cluster-binding NifX family protein